MVWSPDLACVGGVDGVMPTTSWNPSCAPPRRPIIHLGGPSRYQIRRSDGLEDFPQPIPVGTMVTHRIGINEEDEVQTLTLWPDPSGKVPDLNQPNVMVIRPPTTPCQFEVVFERNPQKRGEVLHDPAKDQDMVYQTTIEPFPGDPPQAWFYIPSNARAGHYRAIWRWSETTSERWYYYDFEVA